MNDPVLYINRELSQLEFIARVLEQSKDVAVPLLERIRFLAICSTILDEFFEVRVAGLQELSSHKLPRTDPDGMTADETLLRIHTRARQLVTEQYLILNDVLLPELERHGFRLHRRADWVESQREWVHRFFRAEVQPVLTPVGLDPAHPFPQTVNKSLNLAVTVSGTDAFQRHGQVAIVQVPRSLPRIIALPPELSDGAVDFLMLSSIIHAHIDELFPGMEVTGCYQFRVTRNSDLWVDEEDVEDLMRALKGELHGRRFGDAVRLEVADNCPDEMTDFLLDRFQLKKEDVYLCSGPVNLNRLSVLHSLIDRPDLKYPPFVPRIRRGFLLASDTFKAIRRGDRMLHHPYDSFGPVVELLHQSAKDPNVLAIKQTLYRVGDNSPVVDALVDAARNGKEVTVLVELRARFDEAENITLAERLQAAGAKVAYGIVGFKTHAKMLMVVRREGGELVRYVHLGTGNYHHRTASSYTDIGLFTCDPIIGEDVHKLFNQLTGLGSVQPLKKLIQSPFELDKTLLRMIKAESDEADAGRPARIIAKMNSLSDPQMIDALYRAARKGVQIDLIIRGHCCLRPGVPEHSENIRVRSIVGRFLEHSRVFHFHAGGKELTYCASADWMSRNLHRRIEIAFPIEDSEVKVRVVKETLETYLEDTTAWELRSDGLYERATTDGPPSCAQDILIKKAMAATTSKRKRKLARKMLKTLRPAPGPGPAQNEKEGPPKSPAG